MMRALLSAAICFAWILPAAAFGAGAWQMAYFYDKEHATLVINDLRFPSASRGVACGYLDEKGDFKPVFVTTDDGGAHWTVAKAKEIPVSLFFVNDSLGWCVAPKGIWRTRDAGRTWRHLSKSPKLLMRVYFLDENHGFAVGAHKLAYETSDGGETWQPIAAAAEPHTEADHTTYNNITFVNSTTGMIDGFSAPPRGGDSGRPEWLDPHGGADRREWPHLSIMLDTHDGGKTWTPSTASMFGRITRATFLPDGRGIGLIEFTDQFKWPSEVHQLDGVSGESTIIYNATDRTITDVLLQPPGTAYLTGTEVVGKLQHSPVPRKLVVLRSDNLKDWHEMDVDYRANAVRAILRAAPNGSLWVATDTGMILKWTP